MGNFIQIINKLNQDYENTTQQGTGEAYGRLSTIFEELGKYVRETIQEKTEGEIKKIINKLRSDQAILPEDIDLIRLWIIGDAENYTKMENNFDDWKTELKRLIGEINKLHVEDPDVYTLSKLSGLFRDGARVLADLFYFLEQKDRMENFIDSTQKIDQEERMILVRLLEQKLSSPDF